MSQKTNIIRDLNDRFRKSIPTACDVPGRVMLTSGIQALCDTEAEPGKHLAELFHAVRHFDEFNVDNDPHHEHDFAAFDFQSEKCFWKIDYYAPDLKWGSEDPSDASQTVRVLTIMLASEY